MRPVGGVALVGPTAAGKSEVAQAVGSLIGSGPGGIELVSVDSMAVYRGMDIGTAKPAKEERDRLAYHLFDLADPGEEFTVRQFQEAAFMALSGIADRGRRALLVGGTGLYLRAVVDGLMFPGRFPDVARQLEAELDDASSSGCGGLATALATMHQRLARLDPVAAGRIAPTNRRRLVRALEVTLGAERPFSSFGPGLESYPPSRFTLVGIDCDPPALDARIAARFEAMMDAGLLGEVHRLAQVPDGLSRTARQALGYRELLAHVETGVPLADAVDEAIRRTRALARRQRSWFRRDPRILWVEPGVSAVDRVVELLAQPVEH